MSGAITVVATVGGVLLRADLPWSSGWLVSIDRPMAEFQALAGNVVRQGAAKDDSRGVATYSAMVEEAQADLLKRIDDGASSVILSDSVSLYEAQMDAKVRPEVRGGRRSVQAEFRIIRRILP
jgi:hypothetical protein